MQQLQLSEATAVQRRIFFHAVDATDGLAPETGLTGTGWFSKNGATPAASSGSLVELNATNMPGRYYIEATAGELDTVGIIEFRFKAAACAEVIARGQVVPFDPYDAVRMGLTALPNAAAEAAGGLYTRGTGAGQINQDANGRVDANIANMVANVLTAAAINADAITAAKVAADVHAEAADAVWDEDIEAAHGTDATAGLLLRALGAAISNRANNATLDALLGVADTAGNDVPDQILDGDTIAELVQQLPPAAPTLRELLQLLYMGYRDETVTSATLHEVKNDAGVVVAKQTLADASGVLTRSEMVTGP